MSKRSIKERIKAIRLAWEREQELVSEGKGTRDWSQDQQKDILDSDKGKTYDENGRAFEGQHIKVVGKIRPIGTTIRRPKSLWTLERISLFLAK